METKPDKQQTVTRLVRAALGNDAGLIGAALLPLFR